jgi:hypothetical protein
MKKRYKKKKNKRNETQEQPQQETGQKSVKSTKPRSYLLKRFVQKDKTHTKEIKTPNNKQQQKCALFFFS